MSVMTPYRSPLAAGSDGFGSLLRAEWTKFRTVRGWIIGLVAGLLLIVGLGALTGANSICSFSPDAGASQACPAPPTGPGGEWVSDAFYFVHQPLSGNGSLTVRVTSLTGLYATHPGVAATGAQSGMSPGVQPWAKAGIIVKASATQGSAYAAIMVTGSHGVRMQWDYLNDTPGLAGQVSAASPRWLRLTRSGDVIRGYDSADGTHWTLVGTATLTGLPAATLAGLFATTPGYTKNSTSLGGASSTGGPALATGTFDDVSRLGAWPAGSPGQWAGQDIAGPADNGLPASAQGYHQSAGTFTVTGSGDIGPAGGSSAGGSSIQQTLTGTFVGLIVLVVVAVMFVTGEYRRGLISTTFAASPRRGRVLAAKAVVLAAVTFAAALVAVAVTVPLSEHLLKENGNPIPPLSVLTQARIEVGTAALLAVAAVFALAAAMLLRRSAGAVTAVIAAIVLPYLLAILPGVLPAGAEDWLARVTPAAGFAIQQSFPIYPQVDGAYRLANGYFPLAPWAGFAVLCAWTAAALAAAVLVVRRRDV